MKIIFLLFLFFLASCGSHSQSLIRRTSQDPAQNVKETDQTLILLNAINVGDLDTIRKLSGQGANLDVRNNEGLTLIMISIRAQQFAVVEYLVSQKVNLEMTTDSTEFDPALTARQYLESLAMDDEVKGVFRDLIEQNPFDIERLSEFIFSAITFKNVDLLKWLFSKGVDPNFVRLSSSGRPKDTALIYLFSLRGVEGKEFEKLKALFDVLVSQDGIDVNLEIKGRTALEKAQRQLKQNPDYQPLVDRLIAMGAH